MAKLNNAQAAGLVGILGAGAVLLMVLSEQPPHSPTPLPPTPEPPNANLCSLCSCNSGVVPCPAEGATVPDGYHCDICGSTDGVVPCITAQAGG